MGVAEHPLWLSGIKSPLLLFQGMSRNFTQEGQRAGASGEEGLQDPPGRENCSRLLTNSLADIESSLQRDAEAAYTHSEVQPPRHSSVSLLLLKPALGCLLDVATSPG